jgi:diguanylate cyclase (GGDEF)-like protein/PAS domain S-box-containing protein
VAGAVRLEVTLALARAVSALMTVLLLVTARPTPGGDATAPAQVLVHLALAGCALGVAYRARRIASRVELDRLALVVTAFDLAFWVVYSAAYHQTAGPGTFIGLFVLVEGAVRFGPLGTLLVAAVVDGAALAWPQYDATGRTPTALNAIVLTVLIAGGVHLVARTVRRQSRQAEHGVRQLSDAFAYASIGLAVVDERGLVEAANPALASLLGEDPEALAGVPFVDLVEPGARAELERVAGEVRAGRSAGARLEARVRQEAGRGRWALVALSRADDGDGERLVVQVEDIHDRKVVEAKLAHQASHDTLTGLPNRSQLLGLMAAAFDAREPMALLFIDLDRFKWVNDSLGHEAGDVLLVEVADRLRRLLRPGDVVARLGGDEFVVLAHGVGEVSTAVALADRVAAALRRPVLLPMGRESYASASIGIAIAGPDDAPETLLRDADTAMYRAKAAGGAGHALFTPSMRAATVRHHEIEGALRRAVLDDEHLEVVYQPEVRIGDGAVRGFEALVRWTDEVWGPVAPGEFVPIAEESDLILDLGIIVLRRALADAADWPRLADGTRPTLAVNVSRRQLVQPGFPQLVAALLVESGVPAPSVCLEVTETALTQNVESVVTALHELRHLGVQIAIDDFGTGHASLTYLTRLPVDVLKVDRLFVSGLGRDERSAAIVGAVTAMGRAFGLCVVAEGVEDEEQLAALRGLDADLAQGYLFSRPVPRGDVAALLRPEPHRAVAAVPAPRQAPAAAPPAARRPLSGAATGADVRYRLMIDLARDVTGLLDLPTVLDRTFAALRQLIDFTGGSVQLLDETDHLRLAATDPPATPEALAMRVPLGQGIGGSIALTGEPRYLADITADAAVTDERRKRSTSTGVRSYFGVPLVTEGRVIGLLQVDSVEPDAWDDADRLVVLAFAPIVAAAVQNARRSARGLRSVAAPA